MLKLVITRVKSKNIKIFAALLIIFSVSTKLYLWSNSYLHRSVSNKIFLSKIVFFSCIIFSSCILLNEVANIELLV